MFQVRAALEEVGLVTLYSSPKDVKLLVLLRVLRMFSFGGVAMTLALYLKNLEFPESQIGAFMTITFVGDLLKSYVLARLSDTWGKKTILRLSCGLMISTGMGFLLFSNKFTIMFIAFLGCITPSGVEVGPFRSIEQASIADLVPYEQRSDCFSLYILLGLVSASCGSITVGYTIHVLQEKVKLSLVAAQRSVFWVYVLCGTLMLVCTYFLDTEISLTEEEFDLDEQEELPSKEKSGWRSILPKINKKSISVIFKVSFLFGLDAFAKSLVNNAWIAYYIVQKFQVKPEKLGSIIFTAVMLSAIMTMLGSSICKRKGPVMTMVVTHFPCALFVTLIPVPQHLWLTVLCIFARSAFQAMDISSKQVFITALVTSEERTSVITITNVMRTLGQSLAPIVTGHFTGVNKQWICFVISGAIRLVYELAIVVNFWAKED